MMRRSRLVAAALVVALVGGVGVARSTAEFDIHAALDARQVVPKPPHPVARAAGALTEALDPDTRTLTWKLVYTRLSGLATSAEIHLGKPGATGPAVLMLCGPRASAGYKRCGTGAHGVSKLAAKAVTAMLAGYTYVNVHTAQNPSGEIRGQILTMR